MLQRTIDLVSSLEAKNETQQIAKYELIEYTESLHKENQQLKEKIKTYEDPEDLTLMFMYCNEKAKGKIEELEKENLILREIVMIKKMAIPHEKIKDKSLYDLYDMPSYSDLSKENQELKKQLKTKHDGFMASVDESCELAEEIQTYKEVIDKINVFLDNHDKNAGKLYYKYDNKYLLSEIKEDFRDILKEVE